MSCGYACVGCGKCQGIARPLMAAGLCPACHTQNEADAVRCSGCGMLLPPVAGSLRSERAVPLEER